MFSFFIFMSQMITFFQENQDSGIFCRFKSFHLFLLYLLGVVWFPFSTDNISIFRLIIILLYSLLISFLNFLCPHSILPPAYHMFIFFQRTSDVHDFFTMSSSSCGQWLMLRGFQNLLVISYSFLVFSLLLMAFSFLFPAIRLQLHMGVC